MNQEVMSFEQRGSRPAPAEISLYVLLTAALLLGGSSSAPDLRLLVIWLVASISIAIALPLGGWSAFVALSGWRRATLIAIPLVPIFQLVPLPPGIWHTFPGREEAEAVFSLLGTDGNWHPLSLTPRDTMFTLLKLLPFIGVLIGAIALDMQGRRRVVIVFLGMAAVSILVGLVQVSTRGALLDFYDSAHHRNLIGFFANRNHQCLMLVIATVFSISFVKQRIVARPASISAAALISITAIALAIGTASRTGLGLMILSLASINYIYYVEAKSKKHALMALGTIVLFSMGAYLVSFNPVVQRMLARFSDVGEDKRWEIWQHSWPILQQYFPWGGGFGSFVPSYAARESLDAVNPLFVNHVHNDYFELAIEAGLPGLLALAALAVVLIRPMTRMIFSDGERGDFGLPSGITIIAIALHSIVDYPLRTQAILALFGLTLGFCLSSARETSAARNGVLTAEKSPRKRHRVRRPLGGRGNV